MQQKLVAVGIGCVLWGGSELFAERCIGPKDNTVAVTYGVPAINPADITWCDDFDSYCDVNCGDCVTGEPTSVWPGYPITPDNLCTDPALPHETFFREPYHWPNVDVESAPPVSSSAPGSWFPKSNGYVWEGWDGVDGWTSEPYTLMYQGGSNTNAYHTFSLEAAANHKFPGMNALNGTDANPLIVRFWMNPAEGPAVFVPDPADPTKWIGPPQSPPNLPLYVELRMENDHAPTDYIVKDCAPEAGVFPIVCQERLTGMGQRPGCPALSTAVHASLAFGWLSTVDVNPCDVDNGRKPTAYHSSVFDGNKWSLMLRNIFGFQQGGFNWDTGQAYFEMKIKTTVVEIKQISYVQIKECVDPPDCDHDRPAFALVTSTAPVPRKYLGAFNRISIGAAPGCQLNSSGECITQPDVWRYMQTNSNLGWTSAYVDNVVILGGVGETVNGACCTADGGCSEVPRAQCEAAGGVFRGIQTTCESGACLGACCQPKGVCTDTTNVACPGQFQGIGSTCSDPTVCPCPTPAVDVDEDGDVDMDDFGRFQRCLTSGMPIEVGCACFDHDGDEAIGAADLEYFAKCATGNGVEWTPSVDCP